MRDPKLRERLAEESYYKDKADEAALDREHNTDPVEYWALAWESLSDVTRRPYRTTVAFVCDLLAESCDAL